MLNADVEAAFDNLSHSFVMERVRRRVKDKRALALVKAFLKAGVLTEFGVRQESLTGTPQGGILSPLIFSVAMSALDAFGSYLSPASAVRIGLVPPVPVLRIVSAGNVAGEGAKMALDRRRPRWAGRRPARPARP